MFTSPRCCHVIASLSAFPPLPMLTPPSWPSVGPHSPRRGKLLRPRRRPHTNSQWQFESVRLTASWLWLRTVTERQAEGLHTQAAEQRHRTEGLPGSALRVFHLVTWPSFWLWRVQDRMQRQDPVCKSGSQRSPLVVCCGRDRYVSGRGAAPTFDVDVRLKVVPSSVPLGLEGRLFTIPPGLVTAASSLHVEHRRAALTWISEGKMFITQLLLHLLSHHWLLILGEFQFLLNSHSKYRGMVWSGLLQFFWPYSVMFLDG